MPYIKQEDRLEIDHNNISSLGNDFQSTAPGAAGRANYILTTLLHQAYNLDFPSYSKINEIIGVLECVKQEFYRRVAAPYEDIKIKENGDVGEWRGN